MAHRLEVAETEEYKNAPYELDFLLGDGTRQHSMFPPRFKSVPPPGVWENKEARERWILENFVPQFRLREKA